MVDLELNELRREFLDEALEKVAEMQAAFAAEHDAQSLDRVAYLAHQLKGSGGSYGYQQISEDAAEVEKAIETLATQDGIGDTLDVKIRHHVTNLRSAIEGATRELETV